VPAIGKQVMVVMEALLNPQTGRRYGSAASDGTDLPDTEMGDLGSAAATTCAECFSCKVFFCARTFLTKSPCTQHACRPPNPRRHSPTVQVPELRALWLLVSHSPQNHPPSLPRRPCLDVSITRPPNPDRWP